MKKLFSLDCRMNRSTFIVGYVAITSAWLSVLALAGFTMDKVGWTDAQMAGFVVTFNFIYYALFLRLAVARLHDMGRSGWRLLYASKLFLFCDLFLTPSVSTSDEAPRF